MQSRKERKPIQHKSSTTKFITFAVLALTVLVSIASLIATFYLKDSTILVTLIPCIFVECGVVTGFYFWIRKIRSIIEFKYEYGEEFMENTLDDIN